MSKGRYLILAGSIGLLGWSMTGSSLAEPLSYSPDRWPARWSAIVQQNQVPSTQPTYGYGSYQKQPARQQQENPWAHNGSSLFKVPASQRPWGEPPRKSRRDRRKTYYRDQRPSFNRSNPRYSTSPYAAGISPAYPGSAFGYGYPTGGLGLAYPYGVSPLLTGPLPAASLLGSPLLAAPLATSPLMAYPYGANLYGAYPYNAYAPGAGTANWPFGAW